MDQLFYVCFLFKEPVDVDCSQLSLEIIEDGPSVRRHTNRKRHTNKKSAVRRAPRNNSLRYVELYFEKQLTEKDELIVRLREQLRIYDQAMNEMQDHLKSLFRTIHGVSSVLH